MKKCCLFFFFSILGISLNAQGSFRIKVVDSKTIEGIPKALIFIEEIPVPDQETDAFGLVTYQNVPQDRKVRVNVRKKGYLPQQVEIIASKEIKVDNNIVIKLEKESTIPQVTIYGEVTDKNNEEIEGASVEVTILGKPFSDVTDESGNYQIRIDGNTLKSVPSFQIEVKKKGCERLKLNESVLQSEYINRDIKLNCSNQPIPQPPPTGNLGSQVVDNIELIVTRFEQVGSKATFYFTLENLSESMSVRLWRTHPNLSLLNDQKGNSYKCQRIVLGNEQSKINLIYGNPVECHLEFNVGVIQITKAAYLKIGFYNNPGKFEFTNMAVEK